MTDTAGRSVAKTISYRILGTSITMAIAWLATGRPTLALAIGVVDMAIKCLAYFVHERLWNLIPFGRHGK